VNPLIGQLLADSTSPHAPRRLDAARAPTRRARTLYAGPEGDPGHGRARPGGARFRHPLVGARRTVGCALISVGTRLAVDRALH
jgi:hypothetical protein